MTFKCLILLYKTCLTSSSHLHIFCFSWINVFQISILYETIFFWFHNIDVCRLFRKFIFLSVTCDKRRYTMTWSFYRSYGLVFRYFWYIFPIDVILYNNFGFFKFFLYFCNFFTRLQVYFSTKKTAILHLRIWSFINPYCFNDSLFIFRYTCGNLSLSTCEHLFCDLRFTAQSFSFQKSFVCL